ncbi:hypothetical protein ACFOG5_18435 [Pedobacter fastidiosus]|uniref:Beta/Gamma crystallin n=1 Tax=Pedobacter fastidiosus TaxID=2765361 RepID=A0ABR7KSK6_9SPHI|nr:hypothetical protein [Pedobacter fastidiosus]MBC6111057.1 hypothetical protein [Pedobacter fastidiosus]
MKKSILLATVVTCLAFSNIKAQTVSGTKLSDIRSDYIEIRAVTSTFNDNIWIALHFGQKAEYLDDAYIKGPDGKKLAFNSAIDCVNKMKNYGYELFQAYSEQNGKDSGRSVYILKRK